MTKQEYIKAIKAKLDEISPFDEPTDGGVDFIAADGDERYKQVKPVVSYIESELDNAAQFCLQSLPLTLISDDIDTDSVSIGIDGRGVGHVLNMYEYFRYVRLDCKQFQRDVTAFISSSSPLYLLQQNRYTRGGTAKPVVVYVPEKEELEVYSFPTCYNETKTNGKLSYVDSHRKIECIHSHIERFIILTCAIRVLRILGDDNAVQRLTNEFNEVLAPILV